MKPCTKCGAVLPLDSFYRDPRAKDGHQSRCKSCCAKPSVTRVNACHCGRLKLRTRTQCAKCAEARSVSDPDSRPRCQAQRCDLPVRGEARGCALHWVSFERDVPSIDEYALAQGEWTW